jgi:acetyltransferase-like isoleucine patch superfamily enzyme
VIAKGLGLIVRAAGGVASRLRNVWYRLLGVNLHGYVWMRRISIPRQWSNITIDGGVSLDDGVVLLASGEARAGKIQVRRGTYINRHTMLDVSEGLEIGEDCLIGPFCYLTDHDHGRDAATTMAAQPLVSRPVRLGRNVWLGAGVIVLKGVTIGDGAIVGAGAVVTSDVAAGTVVAGVPARVIAEASRPCGTPSEFPTGATTGVAP